MIASDPGDPEARTVASLFVNCSLRLRNFDSPGFAASDTCQQPADSGVELASGNIMWRCLRHRGMRTLQPGDLGKVVSWVRR